MQRVVILFFIMLSGRLALGQPVVRDHFNLLGDYKTASVYHRDKELRAKDRISFFEYRDREKNIYNLYEFEGSFKNNLPDGKGTFFQYTEGWDGKQTKRYEAWRLEGEWTAGKLNGLATFTNQNKYSFKGYFVDGIAKEGLYRGMYDTKGNPTLYYSGEVSFNGVDIEFDGFGRWYFTGDETAAYKPDFFKPRYYAGQFYKDEVIGFGLMNREEKTDTVIPSFSKSKLVLCAEDILLHTYPSDKLFSLFPQLDSAINDEIKINEDIKYKGTTFHGEPYGWGYFEYKDGYRDYAIFKGWAKMGTQQLLSELLPDSAMLQPRTVTEYCQVLVEKPPKNKGGSRRFELEWEKRNVIYYAAFTAKGKPEGWGWKINGDDLLAQPEAGYFNGKNAEKKKPNTDTSFLFTNRVFHAGLYPNPNVSKTVDIRGDKIFHKYYRFVVTTGNSFAGKEAWMNKLTLGVNMEELRLAVDNNKREIAYNEAVKKAAEEAKLYQARLLQECGEEVPDTRSYSNVKKMNITNVFINESAQASYVTDGEVKKSFVQVTKLEKNDYVWNSYDRKLYRVNRIGTIKISLSGHKNISNVANESYWVLRDVYLIPVKEKFIPCSVCNGKGGTPGGTLSGSLTSVSGYSTSTGGSIISGTTSVISSPVYSSTRMSISFPPARCKACKGTAGYRQPVNVDVRLNGYSIGPAYDFSIL